MRSRHWSWCLAGAAIALAGCGGGGGASPSGGGAPAPAPAIPNGVGSARITVDTVANTVAVEGLGEDGRAIFDGSAVGFTGETVLSEGSPQRRIVRAKLTNFSEEKIGDPVDGFKLHFSGFQNNGLLTTDFRTNTNVLTLVSSGPPTDGTLSNARTSTPRDVAYDRESGSVLFTDSSGVVRQIKDSNVSLRAGLADNVLMTGPIAVSPRLGIVWAGHANQVLSAPEGVARLAILAGSPTAGFVDGVPNNARFNTITDIEVERFVSDQDFSLIVVDQGNNALRRVDFRSGVTPDQVNTIAQGLTTPRCVAQVNETTFLVTQQGTNQIRIISSGSIASAIGTVASGSADGRGTVASFNAPSHISRIDGGWVVADSGNNRIRLLRLRDGANPASGASYEVATLAGTGVPGITDGLGSIAQFSTPLGIAGGAGQEFFVSDNVGNRIRRLNPVRSTFTTGNTTDPQPSTEPVVMSNADGFSPAQGSPVAFKTEDGLLLPRAVRDLEDWQFIVPEGVSTFSFVVTVESKTDVTATLAGINNPGPALAPGSPDVAVRTLSGGLGPGYLDGPVASALYSQIGGVAYDKFGNIFVADTNNHAIRRIDRDGTVTTIAGKPTAPGSIDGLSVVNALRSPAGIAVDPEGKMVYFTELGHTVRKASFFIRDDINDLIDNDIKLRTSWRVDTIAGVDNTPGDVTGAGNEARLREPVGIAYVSDDNLYVLEKSGHRVRALSRTGSGQTAANWSLTPVAGLSIGFGNGTGTVARFNLPQSLAITPAGSLIVADGANQRIRLIQPGGVTSTLAGTGSAGYKDGPGAAANFNTPTGVAVDSAGYVYVTQASNGMIRRMSPTGFMTTVAGGPGTGLFPDGSGATARFAASGPAAVSPSGDLLVAEANRLRLIQRVISN